MILIDYADQAKTERVEFEKEELATVENTSSFFCMRIGHCAS